jgi:hypothetical protein
VSSLLLFYFTIQRNLFSIIHIILLAILGLVTLLITGALGGAIVYGVAGDPFTAFVYKIFFP